MNRPDVGISNRARLKTRRKRTEGVRTLEVINPLAVEQARANLGSRFGSEEVDESELLWRGLSDRM
jgi:hypothetical protein